VALVTQAVTAALAGLAELAASDVFQLGLNPVEKL